MSTAPAPAADKAPKAAKKVAKKVAMKVAKKVSQTATEKTAVKAPRIPKSHHYHVYVIALDDRVWNSGKFRRCNPEYQMGKPFVYVGMTGLDPDTRFDKHKASIQANKFVTDYGLHLLPALYEKYNPMPYQAAREMEVELAIALQAKGFGVWQG